MYPQLPEALIPPPEAKINLKELWIEVCVEVVDYRYFNRTHNRRTYDAGCRGPACAKAVRDYGRRRNATQPNEKYKYIDPIVDYWHEIATKRLEDAQKTMLDTVISA